MKLYNYLLPFLLAALVILFSCHDEELIKGRETVEEGIPTMARLPFAPEIRQQIDTKAASGESLVRDLYVFIFDEEGNKVAGRYFSHADIDEASEGSVLMAVTTGRRYIYGVANLSTNDLAVEVERLDRIDTRRELLAETVKLKSNSIRFLGGYEFMSGFYGRSNQAEEAPVCVIREDGTVDEAAGTKSAADGEPQLKLKRLQSKITFDVQLSSDPDCLATSFVLDSFSVMNVPQVSALVETGGNSAESSYFSAQKQTIFNEGKSNFTFYMLENKREAKQDISAYDQREEKEIKDGADPVWTNAPDFGTYVVLKGRYKGRAIKYTGAEGSRVPVMENGKPKLYDVDADVTYYIHLGYVGNQASDFKSKRNKEYIYHVSVYGVDQIVLEVETDDPTDRADGDIYYMDGENIFDLDAHYASRVLKFTRKQLGETGLDFKILVNSNRTNGFEDKDTGWLTFVKNPQGEQRGVCYPGKDDTRLLSAAQFVADLQRFKTAGTDPDETVYYTCYIQEYYDTDANWKEYVNQNDRVAQIICNTHTGNGSNTVDAAYIIRQKSIQTFYNCDLVESAWGLEWTNETTETKQISSRTDSDKPIEVGLAYGTVRGTDANDEYNGRWNMMSEIGSGASWYKGAFKPKNSSLAYVDYESNLKYAYAACMQRNRDENGDGVITGDEIKWYLPAIYQYTDISVGTNVLPERAQLYTTDDYNTKFFEGGNYYWMFKHFVSNTSQKVFWAEEGGPYGDFGASGDGHISNKEYAGNNRRQFRCVRNLGRNSSAASIGRNDLPQDFVTYRNRVMDLTHTNPKALRTDFYADGELGQHSERDYLSRPYTKFQVAEKLLAKYTYKQSDRGDYAACSDGYYPTGSNRGEYKKSTNYYTNGSVRYFQVDAGKGEYMSFTDKTSSGGYYYYNTGIGGAGRYKRSGNSWSGYSFQQASSSTSDLSQYTWIRSTQNNYDYGKKRPTFYPMTGGDFLAGSKNKAALYYSVGKGQGDYNYCGDASTNYHDVGVGYGNYVRNESTDTNYSWAAQNRQADNYHTSACSEYAEASDGSDRGTWRMPNLRESLLLRSRAFESNIITRTYYSFFLTDMKNFGQNDNGLPKGYSIYSPADTKSRMGFAVSSLVYLISPPSASYGIRCVKDVN